MKSFDHTESDEDLHSDHQTALTQPLSSESSDRNQPIQLRRELSFLHGISIVVGTVIGAGIFATPAVILKHSGSVGVSFIIWLVSGVLSLLTALCYIELGCMISTSGSEYAYLREAFGSTVSYVWFFATAFILRPSGTAMASMIMGHYIIETFYPECSYSEREDHAKILAFLALGIISAINCFSVRLSANVTTAFTGMKLVGITIIVIVGIIRLFQGYTSSFQNAFSGTTVDFTEIGYAFYGGLFTYDGWHNINMALEELKNPKRNLRLCLICGLFVISACYLTVNVGYLTVMTPDELIASSAVAATVSNRLFGVMRWIIPVIVACSCFGAINGASFSTSRLFYVAARDQEMPMVCAMLHRKWKTPIPAVMIQTFLSMAMLIPKTSNFASLLKYNGFLTWLFYGMTIFALLWLRYSKANMMRPYKVFIGIPILVVIFCLYLFISSVSLHVFQSCIALLVVLISVPIHIAFVRYKLTPKWLARIVEAASYQLQIVLDLSMPDHKEDTLS